MSSSLVTLILGGLSLLVYYAANALFLKPRSKRERLRKQGIDGPLPHIFFGNIPEIKSLRIQEVQSRSLNEVASAISHRWPFTIFPHLQKWRKQYGPICLYYGGNIPFLMVQDTEMVKEVSSYTSLNLGKPSYLSNDLGPLFGQGIVSSSGPLWAHQRKIIAPQLYLDKVKGMIDLMVESTNIMLKNWEARIESKGGVVAEMKIDEDLRSLSADIIARACFGSNYEKGQQIFTKLRIIQKLLSKSPVGLPGQRYLPTRSNREIWRLEKEINSMITKLVNQRLREGDEQDLMQMIGCLKILLPYLQITMVIQETLRLYPPATFVVRSVLQDIKLKGILIPKGINIQIPVPLLQQDPELWGADAHMFNPQRFANGISEACKTPQAYLPFGIGARICAGQHLAMIELKVILSLILLRFRFSLSPCYRHSPAFRLVIEPEEGVVLRVSRI
ncbi:cytochrome P450 714C2-like [Neltuma alba]|uniref:cytochrome P450 714C2-like n=1 Tax=Neltuma alba TaxID=207710 RepID=UPI0010A51DB8|nr:cytochrome P450 714C2-like [Prosopis alba]